MNVYHAKIIIIYSNRVALEIVQKDNFSITTHTFAQIVQAIAANVYKLLLIVRNAGLDIYSMQVIVWINVLKGTIKMSKVVSSVLLRAKHAYVPILIIYNKSLVIKF